MSKLINHSFIGKKVAVYCTGMIVEATITEATISGVGSVYEQVEFKYKHKPIQWGNDTFTMGWNRIDVLVEDEFRTLFNHINEEGVVANTLTDGKRITAKEVTDGIITE